jgi:3-isopropylmalate dehydrogenase
MEDQPMTETRLSGALGETPARTSGGPEYVVGVLVGEGIGAEVVPIALDLLDTLAAARGIRFDLRYGGAIGKQAMRLHGCCLTEEVADFCAAVFAAGGALFCGPGGDRFVYELRARFDLYCKFTPLRPLAALADSGPLRPERLAGVDIVAVRENSGGLYLGEWSREETAAGGSIAHHRFSYRQRQVERILATGIRLACQRRGRLAVTVKPGGVPSISALWEELAVTLCRAGGVELQVLEIDNAAYRLIAHARDFDVIVSPNMFGDVLADCGALLLGSRGLSFSGNFAADGKAVFQTGHGAAQDLAGTDRANPVGQIFSLAMLLRESFGLEAEAAAIEAAVAETLRRGYRTADIAGPGAQVVGSRELGRRIREQLAARLEARMERSGAFA